MNRDIIANSAQAALKNHPTIRETADKLHGKAVTAAEATRGILRAIPDTSPEYSLLQSLWFIADALDDAADAYDWAVTHNAEGQGDD